MTAIANTNYVLNIYIQSIKVQKQICCIDQNHETCISFKFLEKVEFNVCVANDPRLKASCPCIIKFEKGKTCMFLMTAEMAKKDDMNLYMEVSQRMPCACLPSKLQLGHAKVDLGEQFTRINTRESKPELQFVSVKNTEGDEIAVADMMIRLSKLNNINFNDFSMNDEGNEFMVKGNNDPQSYTFKRAGGHEMNSSMGQEKGTECFSDRKHLQSSHKSFVGGMEAGGMWDRGWDEGFGGTGGGGTGGGCCGGNFVGGGGFTGTGGNQAHGPAGTCSHPSGGCGCFVAKKTYDENVDEVDLNVVGNQISIKIPKGIPKPSFFDYPRPVLGAAVAPAPIPTIPQPTPAPVAVAAPVKPPAPVIEKPVPAKVVMPVAGGMMAPLPVRVPFPTIVPAPVASPTTVPAPVVSPTIVPAPVVSPTTVPAPVVSPTTVPAPVVSPTIVPAPVVSPTIVPAPVASPTIVPASVASPPPEPPATPASPQHRASSPENSTTEEEKPYVIRIAKRRTL